MGYRGHLLLGFVFILVLYLFLSVIDRNIPYLTPFKNGFCTLSTIPLPLSAVAVPLALYGSVLPDIDTPKSKIFVATFSSLLIVGAYSFCLGLKNIFYLILILILLQTSLVILGHRKLTHKFSFALIYGALAGIILFDFYIALFAFVGYCSHLIGDKIKGKSRF